VAESLPPGEITGNSFADILEIRRFDNGLTRVHPVGVAPDGIDFAVVANHAVRMRQLPGRKRIGGEALVHHAERAHHVRIGQFTVELRDLRSQKQPLVTMVREESDGI